MKLNKTIKRVTGIGATVFLALILLQKSAAASGIRLFVPTTPTVIHAHGYLTGYSDKARFILHAHKNERIEIDATVGGPTVVMVYYPDGSSDGAPGGIDITAPATGDIQIVATEHTMGEPWKGPVTLTIRLH